VRLFAAISAKNNSILNHNRPISVEYTPAGAQNAPSQGEVAERLNALVLKTSKG
jgi:hypothetical protein